MHLGGYRQHRRVQLDTSIKLKRGQDGSWLQAKGVDLSVGGVGVQVAEALPVGTEVHCALPLLGERGRDLELTGTVAWVEGNGERPDTKTLVGLGLDGNGTRAPRRGMGVRWSDLPPADAQR